MPVDRSKAGVVQEWIVSKRGGEARIINQAETMAFGVLSIPSISPTFTRATSGGAKIGHFQRYFGPEGSGKSMNNWGIAYSAQNYPRIMSERYEREIKYWEAQRKKLFTVGLKRRLQYILKKFPDGMNVMLFDTEQRALPQIGERLGVNMHKDHCLLVDQNIIEEIVNEIKGAVDAYHVFMIDSVSNAQSYMEANLQPGDYDRGSAASAWKRLRQVRKRWDPEENTLILVDQLRSQGLGGRGPSKPAPSQIRFLKHNVSVDVEFDRGIKLYLDDNLKLTDDKEKASNDFRNLGVDGKAVAGLEMRLAVPKNSTGKPYQTAVMRFKFDVARPSTGEIVQEVGFDTAFELFKSAEYYHVIEAGAAGMYYLLDSNFKRTKKKWKGAFRVIDDLSRDTELQELLLTRLQLDT